MADDANSAGGMSQTEINGIALGSSERVRLAITAWAFDHIRIGLGEGRSFDQIVHDDLAFGYLKGVDPIRVLAAAGAKDLIER